MNKLVTKRVVQMGDHYGSDLFRELPPELCLHYYIGETTRSVHGPIFVNASNVPPTMGIITLEGIAYGYRKEKRSIASVWLFPMSLNDVLLRLKKGPAAIELCEVCTSFKPLQVLES